MADPTAATIHDQNSPIGNNYCPQVSSIDFQSHSSVEAIRAKVSFAKEKGLLGYSVFQLDNDDNWELSTAAKDQGGRIVGTYGYVPPEYVRKVSTFWNLHISCGKMVKEWSFLIPHLTIRLRHGSS
ncbi:hypothetical protein Q3G72_014299 [Acer saccharum]|nr:hypothetical protein Q3G72_014299 [Acer saccharum]